MSAPHPVFNFLHERFGGRLDPYWPPSVELDDDRGFSFAATQNQDVLFVNHIDTWPQGQGVGTSLMEALREWCQAHQVKLCVRDAIALDFFDRFDWLAAHLTGERAEGRDVADYWFRPALAHP